MVTKAQQHIDPFAHLQGMQGRAQLFNSADAGAFVNMSNMTSTATYSNAGSSVSR